MRRNTVSTQVQTGPELRRVRLLRRIADAPAVNPGEVCGLPAAVALVAVVIRDAEPVEWKPTAAELREAARALFLKLDSDREAHGLSDAEWWKQRGMARRYDAIAAALGNEEGR
jgi:hypothetical protein